MAMAAPCRKFSSQIFGISRRYSQYSYLFGAGTRSKRIGIVTLPKHRKPICIRPLSVSCQRLCTSSPQHQPSDQKLKFGFVKKAALKIHHATIWFLNKTSPKARVFYERFVDGMTAFITDFRYIYSLNKQLKNKEVKLEDLPWRDLYMKAQMKQDIARVFPTLVIVNIPFVYYVTLPIVLYFQRVFLSDHFITAEDISNNHQEYHKKRLQLHPIILKKLGKRLQKKPINQDCESLQTRISQVEKEPFTAAELLSYRSTFSHQTSLKALSRKHLKYLCKLHGQWVLMAPNPTLRKRLSNHAALLSAMDGAVMTSGLQGLDDLDLRKLCNQRGFNPIGSDRDSLTKWLTEWSHISTSLTDDQRSLLLHASILLVAGHPHQRDGQDVQPS